MARYIANVTDHHPHHLSDAARVIASVLLICAFNTTCMCRVSTQITGNSASARALMVPVVKKGKKTCGKRHAVFRARLLAFVPRLFASGRWQNRTVRLVRRGA